MNDRTLSLLGIARRAGRVSLGNDAAIESIRKGEARLVIFAQDLSPRTAGGVENVAREWNIPCIRTAAPMDDISMAMGKRTGVIAVNDAGFAKKLTELLEQSLQTNGREW